MDPGRALASLRALKSQPIPLARTAVEPRPVVAQRRSPHAARLEEKDEADDPPSPSRRACKKEVPVGGPPDGQTAIVDPAGLHHVRRAATTARPSQVAQASKVRQLISN